MIPELDPVIHAQARLRVVSALAEIHEGDQIAFLRLQDLLEMTTGNLSTHVRKLQEAGYVDVHKTFHHRTPATYLSLTSSGRAAFDRYVDSLRQLLARNGQGGTDQGGTDQADDGQVRSEP